MRHRPSDAWAAAAAAIWATDVWAAPWLDRTSRGPRQGWVQARLDTGRVLSRLTVAVFPFLVVLLCVCVCVCVRVCACVCIRAGGHQAG